MYAAIAKDLELLPLQLGGSANPAVGSPDSRGSMNGTPSFAMSLDRAQAGATDGPVAAPPDAPRAATGKQPTWTGDTMRDSMGDLPISERPSGRGEGATQEPREEGDGDATAITMHTVALADATVLTALVRPAATSGKPELSARQATEAEPIADGQAFAPLVTAGGTADAAAPAGPSPVPTPPSASIPQSPKPPELPPQGDKALTMPRAQLATPPGLQGNVSPIETGNGMMVRPRVGAGIAEGAIVASVEGQAPQAPETLVRASQKAESAGSAPQTPTPPLPMTARLSAATRAYDASSAPADPVLVPGSLPGGPAVSAGPEPVSEQVAETPAADTHREAPRVPEGPSAQAREAGIGLGREQARAIAPPVSSVAERTGVAATPEPVERAAVLAETTAAAPQRPLEPQPDLRTTPTAPIAPKAPTPQDGPVPQVEPAPTAARATMDEATQNADTPGTRVAAPAPEVPESTTVTTTQSLDDTGESAAWAARAQPASATRLAAAEVPTQPAPTAAARPDLAQAPEAQAAAPQAEPRQASVPAAETGQPPLGGPVRVQSETQPLGNSPTVQAPVAEVSQGEFGVEAQPSSPRSSQPVRMQGAAPTPSREPAEMGNAALQTATPETTEASRTARSAEAARPAAGSVAGRAPMQAEPRAQAQVPAPSDSTALGKGAPRPTTPEPAAAPQATVTVGVPEGTAPAAESPVTAAMRDGGTSAANTGTTAPAPAAGPAPEVMTAAPLNAPAQAPVTVPNAPVTADRESGRQMGAAATAQPIERSRPPAAQFTASAGGPTTPDSPATAVSGTTSSARPPATAGAPASPPPAAVGMASAPVMAVEQPTGDVAAASSQAQTAAPLPVAEASRRVAPQVTAQVATEVLGPAASATHSMRSAPRADARAAVSAAPSAGGAVAAVDATGPVVPVQESDGAGTTKSGQDGAPSAHGPASGARQVRRQGASATPAVSASPYANATETSAQGTRTSRRAQVAALGVTDTAAPSGPDAPGSILGGQLVSSTSLLGLSRVDELRNVERARHVVSQIAQIEDATPSSLRIDLDWEDTGVRHLAVSLQDGRASLQFYCINANSASHLRALEAPIREALEANGLQLSEFSATYDGNQQQAPERGQQDQPVAQAPPTTTSGAPRRVRPTPTRTATAPRVSDGRLDVLV